MTTPMRSRTKNGTRAKRWGISPRPTSSALAKEAPPTAGDGYWRPWPPPPIRAICRKAQQALQTETAFVICTNLFVALSGDVYPNWDRGRERRANGPVHAASLDVTGACGVPNAEYDPPVAPREPFSGGCRG